MKVDEEMVDKDVTKKIDNEMDGGGPLVVVLMVVVKIILWYQKIVVILQKKPRKVKWWRYVSSIVFFDIMTHGTQGKTTFNIANINCNLK